MKLRFGDMWSVYPTADLFVITSNGVISPHGSLIMGKGIAGEAAVKFPNLPRILGAVVRTFPLSHPGGMTHKYHFLVSPRWPEKRMAVLQTKYHWRGPANLRLIIAGLSLLYKWSLEHPNSVVHLNMPGIGEGRLPLSSVMPHVKQLPDNVHVWQKTTITND